MAFIKVFIPAQPEEKIVPFILKFKQLNSPAVLLELDPLKLTSIRLLACVVIVSVDAHRLKFVCVKVYDVAVKDEDELLNSFPNIILSLVGSVTVELNVCPAVNVFFPLIVSLAYLSILRLLQIAARLKFSFIACGVIVDETTGRHCGYAGGDRKSRQINSFILGPYIGDVIARND